jgi:glycosyltransferase involved in cell wall biosynthesis
VGLGAEPKAGFGAAAPIPLRFIYTSDPVRGVDHFFDMIPKLREKYTGATFYVFGKPDQISDAYREKVNEWNAGAETPFIFLSPRVSQAQLATELMKSDVWLYPSIFEETYCISAVEAMAAGCLVATISLAALTEIVGNRGILADNVSDLFTQLCDVLDDPSRKQAYIQRAQKWAHKQTFEKLADEWERDLFSL